MAGVAPRFQTYAGNDPLGDVVSWNLKRRHLTVSQQAVVGAEAANIRHGEIGGGHDRQNCKSASLVLVTQAEAAKMVGVSERLVADAVKVKNAAPEIFEEVKAGRMTVNAAKQEVKRRQLSTSQKAALAVALKPMFDEQAHERQIELGKTHGDALSANLREGVKGKASEKAAEAVA